MFKIYGVTKNSTPAHTSHDAHGHSDTHHHGAGAQIDVEIHDDHAHETDIGQIALDILDTPSSIIIVAPIA
jgi:hypothetical protein